MKDFSKWDEYEGVTEGSGRSEKIWLQDSISKRVGLFKFKKDIGTTDHISECIAYQFDIVNIGLHFILKNVRPYAASCSEA